MAVRDFTDENGVKWKAWPVLATAIHPRTAAEDFLGDYGEGWLCFESPTERRRLAKYPTDWDRLTDGDLRNLLKSATAVPTRKGTPRTPPKPGDSASP
ncbi:MAG: hypothetical protein ABR585_13125 [Gemmatimonadaceae bacterium]